MRIGIDARRMLGGKRSGAGVAQYVTAMVWSIVEQLEGRAADADRPTIVLFVDDEVDERIISDLEVRTLVDVEVRYVWGARWRRLLPFVYPHVFVALALRLARLDVYFSPADWLPLLYTGRSVVVVHDLAIYDNPEWFPGGQWLATRVVVPRAMRRAVHILAVSEATKEQVLSNTNRHAEEVTVVYEGAPALHKRHIQGDAHSHPHDDELHDPQEVERIFDDMEVQQPYLFFLGTVEPRKNIARLVSAFGEIAGEHENLHLVIAGKRGWNMDGFFAELENLPYRDHMRFLGYISEQEKAVLLDHAAAFVFPSLWEGFGLPILEAQVAGIPVVSSEAGGLAEVVGESVEVVDPLSVDSIAVGITAVIDNESHAKKLVSVGKQNVERFNWDDAAAQVLEILEGLGQDR